jgi:hypothetical protein
MSSELRTFVVGQFATRHDNAPQPVLQSLRHLQPDQPIGDQDRAARGDIFQQVLVVDGDVRAVTALRSRYEIDLLTTIELHLAIVQDAQAELRPLDVLEQGNVGAGVASRLPHPSGELAMGVMAAVGEVEPGDIEPGVDQFGNLPERGHGGPHRCHDLGLTTHGASASSWSMILRTGG